MTSCPRVTRLSVEHRDALGIGSARPRLSWVTETTTPGWRQAQYEVEIDGRVAASVASDASVLVPWPSAPLTSREQRAVRVRVAGDDGAWSPWSEPLDVEAGLLHPTEWQAQLAVVDLPYEATALLRRDFHVPSPVRQARLYVSALGIYEVELNGHGVGDEVLGPGWTSYDHRLQYQTFDVTGLVRHGANAIGATLADGWYRGRLGFGGGRPAIYGDDLALLAQLEIVTSDGRREIVGTDGRWRWTMGPTTRASIYDGEDHDARLEPRGWSSAGFDDRGWLLVTEQAPDRGRLVTRSGPPVRRIEEVSPVHVTTSPSGRTIVDFGQNLVGRLRITVDGPAGTQISLRHAEILEDGELCIEPLRTARQTDRYTLAGAGTEVWEPRFTFHGFRYAEVGGWPGKLHPDDIVAVVCHSDLRRTGWFECSDVRVNRLHDNVVWGMRGNFVDIPTDCPQRDERLGWTGDINVFAPTACFLHDVAGFLISWLADLAAEQDDVRGVPFVVPNVLGDQWVGTAVWGDAAVAVPWTLYERSGDVGILAAQYPSMRRWVEWIIRQAGDEAHWEGPFQFGDWLDPAAPPDDPAAARTDRHLVANAWFCHSLDLLARTADLLAESGDATRYRSIHAAARRSFVTRYVAPDGTMTSDAQTAYALAIRFGLLGDETMAAGAARRLVELVEAEGHHIGTGFAGTPIVCDALCDAGAVDTAYQLLLQTEAPSWLYPVLMGATTIWERWDGIRPDGTRNPGEMNSFNHYALGAVADWLHRRVAGLAPAAPGYRRLLIHPLPSDRLEHARAWHDTPYGRASAGWHRRDGRIVVTATVPPNTSATVVLPDGRPPFEVAAGDHEWTVAAASARR